MSTISVLVADADYLIREGLKFVLSTQENIEVKSEARNERELLQQIEQHDFQVITLDYNQKENFKLTTIEKIKKKAPNANLLIISSDTNKRNIEHIIAKGINNILTKCCTREEIIHAVHASARREKFFCKTILDHLVERSFRSKQMEQSKQLTPREQEIVKLIAQGFISKEIADQLNITVHTVYTHRKKILRKLNVRSASELVLYAANQGLID